MPDWWLGPALVTFPLSATHKPHTQSGNNKRTASVEGWKRRENWKRNENGKWTVGAWLNAMEYVYACMPQQSPGPHLDVILLYQFGGCVMWNGHLPDMLSCSLEVCFPDRFYRPNRLDLQGKENNVINRDQARILHNIDRLPGYPSWDHF